MAALQAAKLRSLTRDRVGPDPATRPFPGGAALVDGAAGWLLFGAEATILLGGALAWARRSGVSDLNVLVDDPAVAGRLARQAGLFAAPPTIWRVDGAALVAATPAPAPVPLPPPEAPELRAVLVDAGLEVVEEDGVLLGEVLGLEVARVSHGPEGPELSVGVGRFDREVGEMTHGHLAPVDRVARVVDIVTQYRRPDAPPHPLNQLVPERWLRAALIAAPARIGASELRAVPSVDGRENLLDAGVATAVGHDLAGRPLVVAAATGVALDLVSRAGDDRAAHRPEARLVLVVPSRDALPLIGDMAAALAAPAEVVGLDGEWRVPWR